MGLLNYEWNVLLGNWEYEHSHTQLRNAPNVTHIEPTNECNFRCQFCAVGLGKMDRPRGFMPRQLFEKIVEENRDNLNYVCLYFHGEPLLHPDIVYFVKLLKAVNCGVGLTTNGMLLTQRKSEELLDSGIDNLCVSFQGVNKEVYEEEQRGGDYETVTQNIEDLLRIKNNGTKLHISILETDNTRPHIDEFVERWSNRGAQVMVGTVDSWFGLVNTPPPRKQGLGCVMPWLHSAVMWNGDVFPCCNYEGTPLGNIEESTVNELWNSEKLAGFRKRLLEQDLRFPCSSCIQGDDYPSGFSGFLSGQTSHLTRRFTRLLERSEKIRHHKYRTDGR
jgi:MoaA/NifB/PqqE/SkfB family radical SAM enzyme